MRIPMRVRARIRGCGMRTGAGEYECHLLLLMQCKTLRLLNLKSKQKSYGMNFYDMQMTAPVDHTHSRIYSLLKTNTYIFYICAWSIKVRNAGGATTIKCWLDTEWVTAMELDWPRPFDCQFAVFGPIFHLSSAHHQFAMTVGPPKGAVYRLYIGCIYPSSVGSRANKWNQESLLKGGPALYTRTIRTPYFCGA